MATKSYPPKIAGSKSGNVAAERKYYKDCIANNGKMENDGSQTQAAPAPKQ